MDFSGMTVEALLERLIETGECRTWEFKSVAILKDNFQDKLARQVSAFANSLGGHIVIGIKEIEKGVKYEPEIVPAVQGRTPTQDWLARMVSMSVSYPLQEFQIHRIPYGNKPEEAIFVIEIGDSPSAPHQTNLSDHKVYYWRYESRTEHAPHFHLELLRNRYAKTILKVEDVDFQVTNVQRHKNLGGADIFIELVFKVVNTSLQVATHWGLHLIHPEEIYTWQPYQREGEFADGVFVRGSKDVLLPTEHDLVKLVIFTRTEVGSLPEQTILNKLGKLHLVARPISQNHVGDDFHYVPLSHDWVNKTQRQVSSDVRYLASDPAFLR